MLIVGAGLSGVGAACHLIREQPGKTFTILESREAIGGTWDLFRYPGVRSDSDMFTLSYCFEPWTGRRAITSGASILRYIRETAARYGVDRHVRFGHRVVRAGWASEAGRWTVGVELAGGAGGYTNLTCRFLFVCAGYFRYDRGYAPPFEDLESFGGVVVHPQHWPADLEHADKKVVVIGSGATAVTLAPSLAARAEHVTMLQRSPTYIVSLPEEDLLAMRLRGFAPARLAFSVTRLKNIALQIGFYQLCRRWPALAKRLIRRGLEDQLPAGYEIDPHFTPRYDPWDQRLCLVPDGDLFKAIGAGRVTVVTDEIDHFTERGVLLRSGRELEADIVVTATGLNLLAFGGIEIVVDGRPVSLPETMAYKGMMLSGVPNFAYVVGYTNASWTLKADLVARFVCRVIHRMDERGFERCVPVRDPGVAERPFIDFAAGYVLRSIDRFPRQGTKAPWRLHMNYALDYRDLVFGRLQDGVLAFT